MTKITRRDFVNGTLMAAGSAVLPSACSNIGAMASLEPSYYPPSLTGLRGSHPGSNTHAHSRAWSKQTDWGPVSQVEQDYDLIVVGGGISGLATAYYYQREFGSEKKILILDNHDDFGGHAKRTEHVVDGQLMVSYGGSQSIVAPRYQSDAVRSMFSDVGVDVERFHSAYDQQFFVNNKIGAVTYFNQARYGEDKIVKHPYCNYPNYVQGLPMGELSLEQAAGQAPISAAGREQLLKVLRGGLHALDVPAGELEEYIATHSYFDYLKNTLGVTDPEVLHMARHSGLDWTNSGTELLSIAQAQSCGAMGFAPKAVYDKDNPYIYHYPDGNASIARALVKKMIPATADGRTAEDLILAQFKYEELDKPNNYVRIRLNSTVVDVHHANKQTGSVNVRYINNNRAFEAKASKVVMACYNMMIPHIVSDLPEQQAAALRQQTKCPLQYTSIGVRNWRAMKDKGIGLAMSPGRMHQVAFMDFPVSMGGYRYSQSPDQPCVLQMISCPYGETVGAPRIDQYREARYKMLGMQFSDYETEIRDHLGGMLGSDLFDFDRDVASITVNRWAHGYTVAGPEGTTEIGRQPFGNIRVANCDSAPESDAKAAIDMAWRAVSELA
ncbi:MAG: NAD(P)-binding protein [Pseudomonadales bacterium]